MKKSTLENIRRYLNGDDTVDLSVLREEVNAEWERTTAKARANANMYADARLTVLDALTDEPTTATALYEKVKDALPDGFTASKVRYALDNYWKDECVRIENAKSANQYKRK